MTKCLPLVVLLILVGALCGSCAKEDAAKDSVALKVNSYTLSQEDFMKRLAEEMRYYDKKALTQETLKAFVEQVVRKELLIQEAVRLKLDREERFVRAIERFWENTLIRDMLERQGESISRRTLVTEQEVAARYEELKKQRPDLPPLEGMADRLNKQLLDEKMTQELDFWIDSLKDQAKIYISIDALHQSDNRGLQ